MFIKDYRAISPQLSHTDAFRKGHFQLHDVGVMYAQEPTYSDFIPAGLLRRMGKAVRMGIGAGLPLIKEWPSIEGIIIGSANGGLEDCIKFLNQIVDYNEGVLTPTNFVNSTPNAVAGQLALMGDKMGYNSTHTNGSLSFDNVLMDARLQLESVAENQELLIGAIEEISTYNYNIDIINDLYKNENVSNADLVSSTTAGSICGEAATMFVVSNNEEGAIAEVVDQEQFTLPEESELQSGLLEMLERNGLRVEDVDAVLMGNSGDARTDYWYTNLQDNLFRPDKVFTYKQFCGDYRTSNGFAFYLALELMQEGHAIVGMESVVRPSFILIYNHFEAKRHSFILVKRVGFCS